MKSAAAPSLSACLYLAGALAPAFAAGFYIEGQDARAIGAALAGAQARRGDAGFAVYNPAGLAAIGKLDFTATASALIIDSVYRDASGVLLGAVPTPGESAGEGVLADAAVPSMAFGLRLSNRLAAGVLVNSPFGLKSTFGTNSVIRYHADLTELKTLAVTPVAAFEISPALSIGGGLRIQYADLSLTSAVDAAGIALASGLGAYAPGSDDVRVAFDADDFALGFLAGVQANPFPGLTLGASYSSKIEHHLTGAARFDIAGSAAGAALAAAAGIFQTGPASEDLDTPAVIQFGAVLSVANDLDLMGSATLARWSSFDRVAIKFENPAQPDEILTQNWSDAWAYSFGAEYRAGPATALRAGLMVDDSPVNDAYASPRISDADRLWLTGGLSHALNDRWSIDAGGAVIFFDDRTFNLPGTQPENLFRGSLRATQSATAYIATARLRYQIK